MRVQMLHQLGNPTVTSGIPCLLLHSEVLHPKPCFVAHSTLTPPHGRMLEASEQKNIKGEVPQPS